MVFIETPAFTRRVQKLLDDESYAELQNHLTHLPDAGVVIRGSGGLRKLRWRAPGRGKRGGTRVIYYWWVGYDRISLLYLFSKNEQSDLTHDKLNLLKSTLEP